MLGAGSWVLGPGSWVLGVGHVNVNVNVNVTHQPRRDAEVVWERERRNI
jgi:hypothetical protein